MPPLRWLFLARKAWLIRARGAHYAQWGEDVVLASFLDDSARQGACFVTEVLEASRFRGRRVALLSIDVEGSEESVLRSLDFARYRPGLVLVESHAQGLEALQSDPAYRRLAGLGYELVNWTGLTAFFRDRGAR